MTAGAASEIKSFELREVFKIKDDSVSSMKKTFSQGNKSRYCIDNFLV